MNTEELEQLKHYLKSLKTVITTSAEFKFLDNYFIKKSKIDDVYVCFLSTLPKQFKLAVTLPTYAKVPSVMFYKRLFDSIKGKFILNDNVYLVKYSEAMKSIQGLITNFEKDIPRIEKEL